MLRLALVLLALFVLIPPLILNSPKADVENEAPATKSAPAEKEEKMELPPISKFTPLTEPERIELANHLQALGTKLQIKLPEGHAEKTLQQAILELDQQIDHKQGKKAQRDPGSLDKLGPLQRQLQALLWKHGGKDYNEPRLNLKELMERLEQTLTQER